MDRPQSPDSHINEIVDIALAEDTGRGDVTTDLLIPDDLQGEATVLIKAEGVLAGIEIARSVFERVDPTLRVTVLIQDGTRVGPGDIAARISGRVTSILKAERVALNFLQRLSGIASLTARYVAEVRGTRAGIYDTRKTTPGLRALEKYAVRMGGGCNHRMDLGDFVLIKDNHIAILRAQGMSLKEIVSRARTKAPRGMTVEVEVTSPDDAVAAAQAGADVIMFDNMSPAEMQRAVGLLPPGTRTEASGGIDLTTVRAAALSGVDIISVGALTHSPKVLDISLELGGNFSATAR